MIMNAVNRKLMTDGCQVIYIIEINKIEIIQILKHLFPK